MSSAHYKASSKIINLSLYMMIIYIIITSFSLLRLIGFGNIVYIGIVINRGMDLLFICTFLLLWKDLIKINYLDRIMVIIVIYPIVIGIVGNSFSLTFVNDTLVHAFFIIKYIIFKNLLSSIYTKSFPDNFFQKFAKRVVFYSLVTGVFALILAQAFVNQGLQYYYQAPAELNMATALSISSSNIFLTSIFLFIAALSGKRMILVSLIIIAMIGLVKLKKIKVHTAIFMLILIILATVFFTFNQNVISTDLAGFSKLEYSFNILMSAASSITWSDFFFSLDPARYIEVASLWQSMDNMDVIFGAGYGFRYEINAIYNDYIPNYDYGHTVSNSHFTPLGVINKFGIIGFVFWSILIYNGLRAFIVHSGNQSLFRYACFLTLCSLLIQSLFSYGFFLNLFAPFVLAGCVIRPAKIEDAQSKVDT